MQIRISDCLFAKLQQLATPFEDEPDAVITRLIREGMSVNEEAAAILLGGSPPARIPWAKGKLRNAVAHINRS